MRLPFLFVSPCVPCGHGLVEAFTFEDGTNCVFRVVFIGGVCLFIMKDVVCCRRVIFRRVRSAYTTGWCVFSFCLFCFFFCVLRKNALTPVTFNFNVQDTTGASGSRGGVW